MIGKVLFLCLLATALGGIAMPDKPFNPEDRIYRTQDEIEESPGDYTTTTEKPDFGPANGNHRGLNSTGLEPNSNNSEPNSKESGPNSKESERKSKEPGPNSKESVSQKHEEPEPNSKEPDPNNKKSVLPREELEPNGKEPNPNIKESVLPNRKELESNSKESVRQHSEKPESRRSNTISPNKHTPVLKNSQQAVSQASDELSPEKGVLKNNHDPDSEETNKKSDLTNIEKLAENQKVELKKPAFRLSQPELDSNEEYLKIPKDLFIKWIQHKLAKDQMDLRKKRIKYSSPFVPDYIDNDYLHFNSLESESHPDSNKDGDEDKSFDIYKDLEDQDLPQTQEDAHHLAEPKEKNDNIYNDLLANIFALLQYSPKNQNQDTSRLEADHKMDLSKELLPKIFELLQYLSLSAHNPDDQKEKNKKETLGTIFVLLQKLIAEQDQNLHKHAGQKTKINKELLADIFALLQILTEGQSHNARQFEGQNPNINEKLLADIFGLLQNLPEEQDQDAPPLGDQKTKGNNELLTKVFTLFQNLPDDQNQNLNEGEKNKGSKKQKTQLLTIIKNGQDLNPSSLEGEKTKDNGELVDEIMDLIKAQLGIDQNPTSLEGEKTNVNKELLAQLMDLIKAQLGKDPNLTSLEGGKTKVNNALLTEFIIQFKTQKGKDQNSSTLEGEKTKDNNELLTQLIDQLSKTDIGKDQNPSSLEGEKVKDNNEIVTQLFIFEKDKNSSSLEGKKTKDINELLAQVIATLKAQLEKDQNSSSLEGEKTKVDSKLLVQLWELIKTQIEQDQNAPPPEQQKLNVDDEDLAKILVLLLKWQKESAQKPKTLEEQKLKGDYDQFARIIVILLNLLQGKDQKVSTPPQASFNYTQESLLKVPKPPPQTFPPGNIQSHTLDQNQYVKVPGQTQPMKLQEYIELQRLLMGLHQNHRPIQPDQYGSNTIRIKLMQLIKDTKEAIDLKVRPVRLLHEAFKPHRLYKIGYLISSINRTHDNVLDFYKHIEQNINNWNILKVLQAYEQVKAADQFLTKALHILGLLCGNHPQQRTLQRSHKRAMAYTHELARERNHSKVLGHTHELALDLNRDLEDTHQGRADKKLVSLNPHERTYGRESQRNNGYNTNKRMLVRKQKSILKRKFDGLLRRNKALRDLYERATGDKKMDIKHTYGLGLQSKTHDQKRDTRDLERLLQRNKKDSKYDYIQTLGNEKVALQRNNGQPQRYQKIALKRKYKRLLQRNQKRTFNDAFEWAIPKMVLQENKETNLERNNEIIQGNKREDNYDRASNNQKTTLDRNKKPELQRNLKIPLKHNYERQRNNKIAYKNPRLKLPNRGLGLQPSHLGYYGNKNKVLHPRKITITYPYGRDLDAGNKFLGHALCNYSGYMGPCNPNTKLNWEPQYQQPMSWSYYDDDY